MIERIKYLIEYKGLSASKFADEIGVQRSGISHILSGRNKPSLEFILKILETYPEVNTDWLIQGKGKMFSSQSDLFSEVEHKSEPESIRQTEKRESSEISAPKNQDRQPLNDSATEIEKIIILYKDKSFREYGSSR